MYCHSLMHAFILCITLYLLCHILYGLSEIKVYIYKTFFFDHDIRYGSTMTFRIGVALESLQNLDKYEPQRFDFCNECKPTE